jgi:hypothetical protein
MSKYVQNVSPAAKQEPFKKAAKKAAPKKASKKTKEN